MQGDNSRFAFELKACIFSLYENYTVSMIAFVCLYFVLIVIFVNQSTPILSIKTKKWFRFPMSFHFLVPLVGQARRSLLTFMQLWERTVEIFNDLILICCQISLTFLLFCRSLLEILFCYIDVKVLDLCGSFCLISFSLIKLFFSFELNTLDLFIASAWQRSRLWYINSS